MNDRQPRPRTTHGRRFGRRFLAALLTGADEALAKARAEADDRAEEDDQCRLRPDYGRQTRGYRETG